MKKLIISLLLLPVCAYSQGLKYPNTQRSEITIRQDPNQARIDAAQRYADSWSESDRKMSDNRDRLHNSFKESKLIYMDRIVADTAMSNSDKKIMLDYIDFMHQAFDKEEALNIDFVFTTKFKKWKGDIDSNMRYASIYYIPTSVKNGSYKSKVLEK